MPKSSRASPAWGLCTVCTSCASQRQCAGTGVKPRHAGMPAGGMGWRGGAGCQPTPGQLCWPNQANSLLKFKVPLTIKHRAHQPGVVGLGRQNAGGRFQVSLVLDQRRRALVGGHAHVFENEGTEQKKPRRWRRGQKPGGPRNPAYQPLAARPLAWDCRCGARFQACMRTLDENAPCRNEPVPCSGLMAGTQPSAVWFHKRHACRVFAVVCP